MKNITNAYLVLSVANIRDMLAAAELEQKVRGDARESCTIVLEDLTVYPCGQIASWTVAQAVAKCARESAEDIAAGLTWTKTGYRSSEPYGDLDDEAETGDPTPDTTCMNHSDAAI